MTKLSWNKKVQRSNEVKSSRMEKWKVESTAIWFKSNYALKNEVSLTVHPTYPVGLMTFIVMVQCQVWITYVHLFFFWLCTLDLFASFICLLLHHVISFSCTHSVSDLKCKGWGTSDQGDKIITLGHQGHGFDSFHRRSISSLGNPLWAAASFLKMMHSTLSLIKEVKFNRQS